MSYKTFKHGGGGGDLIYGLATMKALGGGILHLNSGGAGFFDSLLLKQPYIEKLEYFQLPYNDWQNHEVDFNLDLFRTIDHNVYTIAECHMKAFNLQFELSDPWLFNIEPVYAADIVINDTGTARFAGNSVDWSILKPYADRCIFIGEDSEYKEFCYNRFELRRYTLRESLEFAQVIKGSKIYVANQSCGLAMAEGMKHPRVADLYYGWAKQFPIGFNGHCKLTQKILNHYLGE
jgi:hypothetical protein